MAAVFLPLFFLSMVLADEVTTPSSLLGPRNFNHHASQYHQALDTPETTKQGPVLFPNDGPPPPRPPLIVTSRPLIESIARSELNPDPQNNSIPQSSHINNVVKPFLARVKDYRPFGYVTPVPDYDYGGYGVRGARYEDYEQPTSLPPIYKVIGDFAKKSVSKIKQHREKNRYENKVNRPEYYHRRNTDDDNNSDNEENQNYAFSYRVKDQKTGDDFSHHQQSSGSATNGEYRVRLPDGRMQIVSYTADENGYQADVRYDDDGDKNGNRIDHHNDNHHDYNHNKFNDNHNSIDNSYNDNYEPYHANQYNGYNQNNDKLDYKNNYLSVNRDYKTNNDDKYKSPNTDYYNQYSDTSKEYYNDDFSKEYESKNYDYAPHRSKYTSFLNNNQNTIVPKVVAPKLDFVSRSTVTPSYEELKPLFVTKKAYNTVQPSYDSKIPVTISVPSTTPVPYEDSTERVVLIGGKKSSFYTNIRNVPLVSPDPVIVTPAPIKFVTNSDFSASPTPMNYLVSTINSLRNNVNLSGPKPVLSNSYIDRINKYLRFK